MLGLVLSLAGMAHGGTVDVARSRIYVFVGKTGAGHEHAVEGKLSKGELDLSRQNAGSLTFDLKSLSADTAAARKVLRLAGETDANTRSPGDGQHAQRHGARHGEISDCRVPGAKSGSRCRTIRSSRETVINSTAS